MGSASSSQPALGPRLVWGASETMRGIRSKLGRLAASDCPVLLIGETGTGKGMLAREIHATSSRSHLPFVHVDCAALAPSVIESEFFGHERGAFTGAGERRPGRFELADEGTVFLDEVAELPTELQAKLLRVLNDRCYERVGGRATLSMRARVLAATNRSLKAEVECKRFRVDLYYRLAVVEIALPALRERLSDVPGLIEEARQNVSARQGRVVAAPTEDALSVLSRHLWPGNVREVFNLVERIAACWPDRPFDMALVEEALSGGLFPLHEDSRGPQLPPSDGLENVLRACKGNVSLASRKLGIPRSTLRRHLAKLEAPGGPGSPRQLDLPFGSDGRSSHGNS